MDGAGRLAEKLRPQADLKAAAIGAVVLLREHLGFARPPKRETFGRDTLDREPPPRLVGWIERHVPRRGGVAATVLLLLAKLATIAVPFTFKWAVDALTGEVKPHENVPSWALWMFAAPILLTVAYGTTRIVMALLTQVRDGIFAKVAMHAVRRLAYITFEHMHLLSLRFLLERKTGGLTRVLERGRNGIESIVRLLILQLLPTIVELALITGVLLFQFDWRYVVVILVTVVL